MSFKVTLTISIQIAMREREKEMDHERGFFGPGMEVTHFFYPFHIGQNLVTWPHLFAKDVGNVASYEEEGRKMGLVNSQSLTHWTRRLKYLKYLKGLNER